MNFLSLHFVNIFIYTCLYKDVYGIMLIQACLYKLVDRSIAVLEWMPQAPSLLEELERGSYRVSGHESKKERKDFFMSVIVLKPGEGRTIPLGPIQMVVQEDGAHTRGTLGLAEFDVAPH